LKGTKPKVQQATVQEDLEHGMKNIEI